MKTGLRKTAFMVILVVAATGVWAQPNGGGGGQGQGGNPPSTSGPIDSGASFLLAAVCGYAYYQKKKV